MDNDFFKKKIINVPINAGLIPPASKSSPGGFGSLVNNSGVI